MFYYQTPVFLSDVNALLLLMFAFSLKDLELNRDFNGDDYEYEDEAKLVIFPDHFEIPLPNIEELPALVSKLDLCVFVHDEGEGALCRSLVSEQADLYGFCVKSLYFVPNLKDSNVLMKNWGEGRGRGEQQQLRTGTKKVKFYHLLLFK